MGVYTRIYTRLLENIKRQCTNDGYLSEFIKTNNGSIEPNIVYGIKVFQQTGQDNRIFINISGGGENWNTTHKRRGIINVNILFKVGYSVTDLSEDYLLKYYGIIERLLDSAFTDEDGAVVLPLDADQNTDTVTILEPEAGDNILSGGVGILVDVGFFEKKNRRN